MFEAINFKSNDKLFEESKKLVDDHNQLSYRKAILNIATEVKFAFINRKETPKYTEPVALDIIRFFELSMSHLIISNELNLIIHGMNYTHEDLVVNIDRSIDTITQLFSSLTDNRIQLTEKFNLINENIEKEINLFIDHIGSSINETSDYKQIIEVIFKCMALEGIHNRIKIQEGYRPFVPVGYKFIEKIFASGYLQDVHILQIQESGIKLKELILGVSPTQLTTTKLNRLQTFGLVPDEGPGEALPIIIERFFGIKDIHIQSLTGSLESLEKNLRALETQTTDSRGLLVIVSSNEDNYFDLSSLYNQTRNYGASGITTDMVHTFDLLKKGNKPVAKDYDLISINVDPQKTKCAYLLWTNDYKTFKCRSNPINNDLIQKLLRKAPSPAIESYNSVFEKAMEDAKTDDLVAFNRIKYMSFNDTVTEESFLSKLKSVLVSLIMDKLGKLQNEKFSMASASVEFSKSLLKTMELMKAELGIDTHLLSSHCLIIYASMADKIVNKIKKELVGRSNIAKKDLSEIIDLVAMTNDNIYSRTIASYYLHIA